MTVDDPIWSDEDYESALAWLVEDKTRCSGCGHHRDETTDAESQHKWDAEAVVCHACAARDQRAKAFRNNKGDESGVYWRIFEREEFREEG